MWHPYFERFAPRPETTAGSSRPHLWPRVGAMLAIIVALLSLTLVRAQAAGGARTVAARAVTVQVHIKNFTFTPHTVRVKAGTTVVWTNQDSVGHTVTSGNNSDAHTWRSSALLSQGQHFTVTFHKPGTYPYYCMPHSYEPNMHGVVIVTR